MIDRKPMWITLTLTLALDQAAKYLFMGHDRVLIPDVLNLTTAFNSGAAMSLLSGVGGRLLLPVLTALLAAGCLFAALRFAKGKLALYSCGLILGGALGNLIDRCVHGYVIDLFELTFVKFYIFNVADIGITLGAALCAVSILFFCEQNWGSGIKA